MAKRVRSEDWELKPLIDLTGGFDTSERPDLLEDKKLVAQEGVVIEKGRLRLDTGYVLFNNAVLGVPQRIYQFYKRNGTSELILVTTVTVYKQQTSEWRYIKGTFSTTCTNTETAGATVIEVPSTTGFSVNDKVGVDLDNGTQHRSTISAINAGVSITIADGIPAGRQANAGAAVIRAVVLSGSLDKHVHFTTFAGLDWLIFTNGVDIVKRYDGTDCVNVPNLPSSGNTVCQSVVTFLDYVLLINTTEGGTARPQRIRWCDTADPTTWATGNAGFSDRNEQEDFLMVCVPLGSYLIVYRERGILRMEYVGSKDKLFHIEPVISGEGIFSSLGVADLGSSHLVFGQSNVYEYKGGYALDPIGNPIFHTVYTAQGDLNPGNRKRSVVTYIEELDEGWIFYPSSSSANNDKLLRYQLSSGAWYVRKFADKFVGYGYYQATDAKTWAELTGDWIAQTYAWNSSNLLANSALTILCNEVNRTHSFDYVVSTDNGTAIPYKVETKDLIHPKFKIRTDYALFRMRGSSILVEYSIDSGQSWVSLGTVSPGASYKDTTLFFQVVANRIRFRLSGSGGGFGLEYAALMHSLESEH